MPVSEKTYEQVALEDPEGQWELHCGRLVEKPPMTTEHSDVMNELGFALRRQLDPSVFVVRINSGRTRRSPSRYYMPDVCVVPAPLVRELRARPGTFEVYDAPLPLVAEVWSPSTGDYDVTTKLPDYQQRGDAEIWLIHPYERTLTAWLRQPNGSYAETLVTGGHIRPVALPGVTIDLDALFRQP